MSTPVVFSPDHLDFGAVDPGAIGLDVSTFVGIIGDTSYFRIRDLFILDWGDEVVGGGVPPGEGPPGKHARATPGLQSQAGRNWRRFD